MKGHLIGRSKQTDEFLSDRMDRIANEREKERGKRKREREEKYLKKGQKSMARYPLGGPIDDLLGKKGIVLLDELSLK